MAIPKEHVEEIRRTKFSIGGELNPLTEDLHQAVKNLSAELYAKDVHFLMELIQNAEDNEYSEGVDPSLEFVITSRDITATGAPATLLIFNNERGFSRRNIDSICSVGRSTKKGNRKRGYIGEKGIGFKSIFLITARPYIFSNGYQIRFNEEPCEHCNVGYIVPEWVDANPTPSEINQIYGFGAGAALPTTVLILPLKPDKVKPVKQQLSSIHPQVLLFLSKIKRLSVREDNEDPRLNTVNAIAITKETDLVQRKNIDAESFTLHLSAEENGSGEECCYYMWKQKFPVRNEDRVERRMEVEEWAITLAFPNGELLQRGTSSPGVYAFLPTEMVTNFPFIIQADFLLASSRETVLLDNKWNQGILNCVPFAFINAFKSLVKDAPAWNLPDMFRFLPVNPSNYKELNVVRQSIKEKLLEEEIVPSEQLVEQKFFHKPREVGRLMPAFWSILDKARKEGVSLLSLSNHGTYILSSAFDRVMYDHILNFLEVQPVDDEWYAKCIQGSMLVEGVSEEVYLELLLFVAENWRAKFHCTRIKDIPLIKSEDHNGNLSLFSISSAESRVYISRHPHQISWLIVWNKEFGPMTSRFFVPKITQEAIQSCPKEETLLKWLQEQVKVGVVDVYDFTVHVCNSLRKQRKIIVSYVHFLYHSLSKKKFLSEGQVDYLCSIMPLVDSYGNIITHRQGVLVPAKGSKWAGLVVSNLWRDESYVELGEDYTTPFRVAGKLVTPERELISFLVSHAKALDVPYINPPNSRIRAVSSLLTKHNAILLLEWIRYIRSNSIWVPNKFITSIKEGSWLKVTLSGSPVSRPPAQSFLLSSSPSWGNLLQNGSVLVDIPLVDENYYGNEIRKYMEELKYIGVLSEYAEACKFIGDHLMCLAAFVSLNRDNVLSILKFIRFLRNNSLPPVEFIRSIKQGKWLRTSCGDRSPAESVLFDQEWRTASKISNIPFIDEGYYGEEIRDFSAELELLGVVVCFSHIIGSHELVVSYLKPSSELSSLSADALVLILQCLRRDLSPKIVTALKGTKCLKTNNGFKSPSECVLCNPEWACLLQVFNGIPFVDIEFYGTGILTYKNELKQLGVMVDFEEAAKEFARCFRQRASNKSISEENVISFLSAYRALRKTSHKFPAGLKSCIRDVKWLRTRHCDYYRSPKDCILYGSDWESIFPIARLPFIDDRDNYYGKDIYEYKKELKSMGVVVDFKDGVKFVASGLYFQDVSCITRDNALSLLECIRILLQEKSYTFPEDFTNKLSQAWLKTYSGYRSPKECLLFDAKWGLYLKKTDGPFIDEEFYGPKLSSYREVLKKIGVTVDVDKGCPLIASQLDFHTEFSAIEKIYNYLSVFNWEPKTEVERRIWIPNGDHKGEWVSPEHCVVSDKSGLFSLQLTILDKHYKENLCFFFSGAFQVKHSPSTEDYCKLWKSWESAGRLLSRDECCRFWEYITKHFTSKTEKTLLDELVKVPVNSGSDGIVLLNKRDVFIADDLQLKELFEQSSSRPIFVWYPQPSLPNLSRTKVLEVFRKIGVRPISESVEKKKMTISNCVGQQVNPRDVLIGKDLVKLILGFLADPAIKMDSKARHKAVEGLCKLTVVETSEPINVSYNLALSSGEPLNVRASKMVRWERESSKLFTQKMDKSKGPGSLIERATYFSEVIAEGVLWENGDYIHELSELIKLAFLLEFNEEAVSFLMKSKNFQIFMEDEDFLSSAFPSY